MQENNMLMVIAIRFRQAIEELLSEIVNQAAVKKSRNNAFFVTPNSRPSFFLHRLVCVKNDTLTDCHSSRCQPRVFKAYKLLRHSLLSVTLSKLLTFTLLWLAVYG